MPLTTVFLARDTVRTSTGDTIIHAQQYYRGLPVFGSTVVVTRRGTDTTTTQARFSIPDNVPTRATVGQDEAIKTFAAFLVKRRILTRPMRAIPRQVFQDMGLVERPSFVEMRSGFDEAIRMHLEVCPMPGGVAELVWVMACTLKDRRRFQVLVTATGRKPRVIKVAQVNACAFQASWVPTGGSAVVEPFPVDVFATPTGVTTPPSVWKGAGSKATGPNAMCLNSSQILESLGNPNVDNAFVWANLLHDFFKAFGFDASSHAFEDTDPLELIRLNSTNSGAADFDNFVDGSRPVMRLFRSPFGGSHASADPSVVIHEYMHGVSSRLVGGASVSEPFSTGESQGLAEGLCDYFALTILNWMVRARGIATPVTVFGQLFHPGAGLRSYAGFTDVMPGKLPKDIYRIGRIWCAAMLDGRASVASVTSEDVADQFLWQALINMLKTLTPSSDPDTDHLTLAQSKSALRAAARSIENGQPTLTGCTARVIAALTARNI